MQCKVARSILFYFVLSIVFQKASTYLPDIFHKNQVLNISNFCFIYHENLTQANKQKNNNENIQRVFGTCVKLNRKVYLHYVSISKKCFKLAVSLHLALKQIKEAFPKMRSTQGLKNVTNLPNLRRAHLRCLLHPLFLILYTAASPFLLLILLPCSFGWMYQLMCYFA